MCGIVGQVRPAGLPVQPGVPDAMCAGLEHRGPDSRGIHEEDGVWLGIQRLRVIDLHTGDQPIYNEDRSVVVVLNGEIYNYRELRSELRARGPPVRHGRRHRGDRPPLRGDGRGLRAQAARDVRVRAVGPPQAAAAAGARPRRQEAARLRAARRRDLVRLGDERPPAGSRDPAGARPRGDRRLPRPRLRAGAAQRAAGRPQAAAGPHAGPARRPGAHAAVLEARLLAQARPAASRSGRNASASSCWRRPAAA